MSLLWVWERGQQRWNYNEETSPTWINLGEHKSLIELWIFSWPDAGLVFLLPGREEEDSNLARREVCEEWQLRGESYKYTGDSCDLICVSHLCAHLRIRCSASFLAGDFLGLEDVHRECPGGQVISKARLNGATPHQQRLAHRPILTALLVQWYTC